MTTTTTTAPPDTRADPPAGPTGASLPPLPPAQHLLVTGAAGFIGSRLVASLLGHGHRVLGLDDLTTGSRANLRRLGLEGHPGFELLEGDAAATLAGDAAAGFPALDGVFHLAASVGVARVVDDPTGCAQNNLDQTRAVLRFARATGTPVLIASSSEVYGLCPVLPCREDADLTFGPTSASRWSYGLAKALDEHLALDAARRGGPRTVVARLFNCVGLGQLGRYGMVLPRFVEAAAADEELVVHGDGRQSRCFCDVRDTAAALSTLLLGGHAGVFNVGGDEPITVLALAGLVRDRARARGLPGGRIVHRSYEEVYGPGFEDPPRRVPDLGRIDAATGWRPRIGLRDTIDGMLEAAASATRAEAVA